MNRYDDGNFIDYKLGKLLCLQLTKYVVSLEPRTFCV